MVNRESVARGSSIESRAREFRNNETIASARVAGLDTLRALAILLVMFFHLNWRLPESFVVAGRFGWIGVDLFFVLSGYLIGSQLLRQVQQGRGVSIREFYRKRAYRILPAYLFVLLIYLVWPGWHEDTGMSPLWEFLTFTENLFVDYSTNHAFSHVWSLCVEEHFYLLFPPVVLLLARRPSIWKTVSLLVGLAALGVAVRSYELVHVLRPLAAAGGDFDVSYIERIYYPTYSRLDGLLAGVSLALVRVFRPSWWTELVLRANLLLMAGLCLVLCAVWMFWNRFASASGAAALSTVIGFPILSVGMALLLPGASDARCWLGRWRIPGAELVAMLAFSLYLTHKEVAHVVHDLLPRVMDARDWRCLPLYGAGCMAVATALHFAVERPMLALRDRSGRRSKALGGVDQAEPAL